MYWIFPNSLINKKSALVYAIRSDQIYSVLVRAFVSKNNIAMTMTTKPKGRMYKNKDLECFIFVIVNI